MNVEEETKEEMFETTGFEREVEIPLSKIYVTQHNADQKQKYTFITKEGSFHFLLLLNAGAHYTQELIDHCGGAYRCYNCCNAIQNKIYFYPTDYTKLGEFMVSPIPHCRAACALRTVIDLPNNFDILSNFHLLYGLNVTCAPPRHLLFIPGGSSSEEYHSMIDDSLVVESDQKMVRSFLAPLFFSCTFLKDHQLVKDVVALIEEFSIENKTSVGLGRTRDNSQMTVIELPTRDLFNSRLTTTFAVDPSSYRIDDSTVMMDL